MDFKRLKYFCALVDKGSFSKAAKSVFMSQPPFSQRIRELEDSVGIELVHRNGRSFQITPEGWEFYHKAQYILSHVNGLINDFKKDAGKKRSLIRIGICPLSLAMYLNSIADMHRLFPSVTYRIWMMDNQVLETALQETQVDFCILQLPVLNDNYKMLRLKPAPFVAVYGKNMPVPERALIQIDDLRNVPLLLSRRQDGSGGYEMFMRSFQHAGITPNILADTQECRLLLEMLENGLTGVAVVPQDEIPINCTLFIKKLGFVDLRTCPAIVTLNQGYLSLQAYEIMEFLFRKYKEPGENDDALERLFSKQKTLLNKPGVSTF